MLVAISSITCFLWLFSSSLARKASSFAGSSTDSLINLPISMTGTLNSLAISLWSRWGTLAAETIASISSGFKSFQCRFLNLRHIAFSFQATIFKSPSVWPSALWPRLDRLCPRLCLPGDSTSWSSGSSVAYCRAFPAIFALSFTHRSAHICRSSGGKR